MVQLASHSTLRSSSPKMRSSSAEIGAAESAMEEQSTPYRATRPLVVEHSHRPDRRAGAAAPLERQPDEAELALSDQRLQIAQAIHVRDVELQACLVDEDVHGSDRPGAHGVDAEMHDPLPRQPLGGGH